ncbi:PREDICTED: rapid alkalinization factor [Theobroma cacao]|uniref:Rapid alkalinization factor n=1 Tax=Theobroma cacao TaxID=3641 RepID=A0AB32VT06_THECC|nr:PREDICTED: rapid alkalinization factor [Theobroma cacao]
MSNPSGFLLAVSLVLTTLIISLSTVEAGGDHHLINWVPTKAGCQGSMAECITNDEFDMDSEINRRILATTQYISYGALQRNTVPCSLRGASYYNCQPGAQANPYSRGCSAITRCRS